jgi:aspartate/methionine/tyrosine aminotransferase
MSVCFEDGALTSRQTLPIDNVEIRKLIESLVSPPGTACDKRFVYYLLGVTGICVVPLTSFATELKGFRITLLERDENEFIRIFKTIADVIGRYTKS